MPKKLEEKLKREARSKGLKGDRLGAYVYGTLRKTGWKPSSQDGHSPMKTISMPDGGEPNSSIFVR